MAQIAADDDKPLNPEQAQIVKRMRVLMAISGLATFLGIAVVIGGIGYRVSRSEGSAASAEITVLLPKGARIVQTAVSGDRIAVTIDNAGATEIRTFDLMTLRPVGRLKFATEP